MRIRVLNRPKRLINAIKVVRDASGLDLINAKGVLVRHDWFRGDRGHVAELRTLGAVVEFESDAECGELLRVKEGMDSSGRTGRRLGVDVFVNQFWTPVLWGDEDDPGWFKSEGLEVAD